MHVDYHKYLKSLALEFLETKDSINKIEFHVQHAPDEADALLGSNLAFILGKVLRKDPKLIAKEIAEINSESVHGEYFKLVFAPSGFINANPTKLYLTNFLDNLEESLNSEEYFNFESAKLETELKKNIEKTKNLDVKTLLESRNNSLSDQKDFKMLLALLGDEELNVQPYLKGLKGKENIPWYLDKFIEDTSNLKQEVRYSDFLPEIGFQNMASSAELFEYKNNEQVLLYQIHSFLNLRSYRKFEDFYSYCLQFVDSFYAYFNHPSFKASKGEDKKACLNGAYYLGIVVRKSISLLARSNISY